MRKWLPLISVSIGTFMLLIDTTVVKVALPSIATSMHASFAALQWVIDGYALAAGIADPAGVGDALTAGQAQSLLARSGAAAANLHSAMHEAALAGLDNVFLLTGVVSIVAALAVVTLVRAASAPGTQRTPAEQA